MSTSPIVVVLRRARALIDKPESWTQRSLARTARGNPTSTSSPMAACFCATGAVMHAGYDYEPQDVYLALQNLSKLVPSPPSGPKFSDVEKWNDAPERTHAEVLALFDRAIKAAGG